jgi:hypothetical protein
MPTKDGTDMGYRTHYVVDGGRARIIVAALVTPSEVMDNQPMLDLLWRVRFRWKLWPRQVTGDRKYGTEDNIVAIEREQISAYIPSPDFDHRTGFFSPDRFHYEAERDVYLCPAGKELRFDRPHSTERSLRYRARARDCNHCPLKAQCTTSKQGRSLCRSIDEEVLDRVRGYQETEAYKKAYRKRTVWVEPLFARSAKTGMACDVFACDGCGVSTVRRSCEQPDKISSACSKTVAGDGVHVQQRPCVASFWLFLGGGLFFFRSIDLVPHQ